MAYNAFIDFHSFSDMFARKTSSGKGIQDIRRIGDKIVHASAFTEPPVNLGKDIAAGSFFKNGEITLFFKGLGVEQGAACAVVEYDSGASSFSMLMKPMPNIDVSTTGASHYRGDIYIDSKTNWPLKITMNELVVSETAIPSAQKKIPSVTERELTIKNLTSEQKAKK